MEVGLRTPLLDFFRRGEVARDIRLLAAQGALVPRAHEQLGLLVLLVGDQDPEIARAAEDTIAAFPSGSLAAFLARSDVPAEFRAFFAARGIEPSSVPADAVDQPLLDASPDSGPDESNEVSGESAVEEADKVSALQKIAALTVVERIALAMKGTREERAILIRDPNKIVGVAVLSSPKVSEREVENIARMASVSEDILRIIAGTRAWVKNYAVAVALTKNPKTLTSPPVAISMNLLSRLTEKDLRTLSTDRNVQDIARFTARKKLVIG